MIRRHKNTPRIPRIWLMTDARLDGQLWAAVQRLPFGSGVIFRHYHLGEHDRKKLFRSIHTLCRRRGHMLILAGSEKAALRWHADGFHNRVGPRTTSHRLLRSAPVHNAREIATALRMGADILLLSPLFATASHKDARPLGRTRFAQLAGLAKGQSVIALGGMNARKGATLPARHVYGWAAIDAFKIKQKLN